MRHGQAHRRYHVWSHVETMLKLADWRQADLFNVEAVEIAILFHDSVYEPGEEENEKRSAGLMLGMLSKIVAPVTLDSARDMILATERHMLPDGMVDPLRSDCAHFLDMDLAILGSDPEVFEAFQEAIREEYIHVPDAEYRTGRRAVLARFLERKRLYQTESFREAFEFQARANLEAAVAELDG
jgi:predicted metal-dependent HD superfamily phosphohydrolase